MKSMTGYGCAEVRQKATLVKAEISSVNKKGLDLGISLPKNLMFLEPDVKQIVQKHLTRGKVWVNASLSRLESQTKAHLPVNMPVLERHHRQLKRLAKDLGCPEKLELPFLLNLPGVMVYEKNDDVSESLQKTVLRAVERALVQLVQARAREGKFLSKELIQKFSKLETLTKKIQQSAPKIVQRYRDNLQIRMKDAGVTLDEERLAKEVALLADRADITEELDRLRAHFKEAKRLLAGQDSAGRNLDFLLQEVNREINTIGSKANGLEISKQVILFKTELEKIREQVQNLE